MLKLKKYNHMYSSIIYLKDIGWYQYNVQTNFHAYTSMQTPRQLVFKNIESVYLFDVFF